MNEKKKMQPKVRFREFTGENASDWEQRKLGEVASVSMCKRIYKNQTLIEGDIPFYKIGTFGGTPDSFISRELYEEYKSKYPYPNKGDILISASGSIGRTVEFTGKDEYFQDSNIVWLNHNENILNIFLKYFYLIVKWDGIEGTNIKRLYNENILKTEISFPSITEQERIGQFFEKLDKLITLHQRKLEQLEQLKNTLLSKMFPKSGTNIPEIRFSGFTDAWKQRKLKEMLEERNELILESNDYPLMSFVQGKGVIPKSNRYDRSFLVKNDKKKYKKTELNDFIYSSNNLETGSIGFNKTGNAVISPVYSIFKSKNKLESRFIAIISRRKDFIAKMLKFRQGVVYGQWKIDEDDFLNISVSTPNIETQKYIIDLFIIIDNYIAIHQRKLDQLKNLKQTLLNKMFI
ncbi:restriction endonuclease subunit S [Enterococcus cecorum]|uniref:restriction endonuclease subunit S n=1 Tax=Enterococcus cecorum TaxID=44008 RepID=UPI0032C3E6CA